MIAHSGRKLIVCVAFAASFLLHAVGASGTDGTWTNTTSGTFNWSDSANWSPTFPTGTGPIPTGPASITTIGTNNYANPNGTIINLDVSATVGNLIFNSRTSGNGWTLGGSQTLTLDNSGITTPIVSTYTVGTNANPATVTNPTTFPTSDFKAPTIFLNLPTPQDQVTINAPLVVSNTGSDGTTGFMISGTGTLVAGAQTFNNVAGPTILNPTLANSIALTFSADTSSVQTVQFGVVVAQTPRLSTSQPASMNVNANVTATKLLFQTTNSIDSNPIPGSGNLVSIASGKTLTLSNSVMSPVSLLSVGFDLSSGSEAFVPKTTAEFAGNKLHITAHDGQFIEVGVNNAASSNGIAILDLSRLNTFEFAGDSSSEIRVGGGLASGTGNRTSGYLVLSGGSNSISAGDISIGGGSDGTGGGTGITSNVLYLGRGTNVINTNNIYIGTAKSGGSMLFSAFNGTNLVNQNINGTLTLAGKDTARTAIFVAADPNNLNSTTGITGNMDLTNHPVDIMAGAITVATRPSNAMTAASLTGTLNFNSGFGATGGIDATNIVMGYAPAAVTGGTLTGTITVGGSAASTATLNVGAITDANMRLSSIELGNVAAGVTVNTTLNVNTNGTVRTAGDILATAVNTATAAKISLAGGTLDLQGHAIGPNAVFTPGTPPSGTLTNGVSITATSGTLKGVSNINNVPSGFTAITKTGSGTLTIAGNNTYAGDTLINGTAVTAGIAGVSVTGKLTGNVTASNGILAGAGDGTTTGVAGNVTLNSAAAGSARIAPGTTLADGDIGTLSVSSLAVGTGGGDLRFDLSTPAGTNDQINATTSVAFGTASTVSLGSVPSGSATPYTLITSPAGTMTGTAPTVATATSTLYSTSRLSLSAPSIVAGAGATPDKLQLTVTGNTKSLTWTGGTAGTWNLNSAQNWSNDGGTTPNNDKFFNLDAVTIPDPATTTTLTIPNNTSPATVLQPASVTVNNSAGHDVTITTGTTVPGSLSGNMSLTKNGTGTLVISTPNTYTGTTTINNGKLVLTKAGGIVPTAATTTAASSIVIGASGTFQFGNGDAATNGLTTNAQLGTMPIVNNGKFIINTTSGTNNPSNSGQQAPVVINNVISGSGTIEMDGTGAVSLAGLNAAFTGPVVVNSGCLLVTNSNAGLGSSIGPSSSTSPITVNSGGSLDLNGGNANTMNLGSRLITIAGVGAPLGTSGAPIGALLTRGTQQQNAIQNLKLAADATVRSGGRLEVKNGTLDLAGHTLTFTGTQSAINNTTVTDGNLIVATGAQLTLENAFLTGNGTLTFNDSSTLRFTGATLGTVTRNIVFTGVGTMLAGTDTTPVTQTPPISTNLPAVVNSNISLAGTLTISSAASSGSPFSLTLLGNITEDSNRAINLITNGALQTDILSGANTFTGGVTIGNSTAAAGQMVLQLGSAGALNASGANALTFASGVSGTASASYGLRLSGFSATISGLTTVASSTSAFVENGSFNDCALTINNANPSTFNGIIQDKGSTGTAAATGKLSLIKNGTGLLTLSNTNTYTGTTTINGGTILLSGSTGSGTPNSAVTVNANATLAGSGSAGNTTLTSATAVLSPGTPGTPIGTLTLNNLTVNSGELKVNIGGTGVGQYDVVSVTNSANFSGTTTITPTFSAPPQTGNSYTLVTASSLTASGTFIKNLPSNARFTQSDVVVNTTSNSLSLQFNVGAKILTWTGAQSNVWDLIGAQNFVDSVPTAQQFFNVDEVDFNGGGPSTVSLSGTLQPSLVKVNSGSYTFSGTGSIAGNASLNVNGGSLTLSNTTANTYNGGTALSGGSTLKIGQASAFPSGSSLSMSGSATTLDLNGNSINVGNMSSPVGDPGGTITNTNGTLSTLTYLGDNSTYPGAIRDGVGQVGLTISAGTLLLANSSTTPTNYSGPTLVQNDATLKIGAATTFSGTTLIAAALSPKTAMTLGQGTTGGNLDLNGSSVTVASIVSGSTGGSVIIGNNGSGTATLTIDPVAAGLPTATSFTYAGRILDNVTAGASTGLVKLQVNSGTITLTGDNRFTGGVAVTGGTISLGSNNAIGQNAATLGAIALTGGTLQYGAGITTDYSARFDSTNTTHYYIDVAASTNVTFNSPLAATGADLVKTGPGTLTLGGATESSYSGDTTVTGGTLALGSNNHISDSSKLVFNGGRFLTNGNNETVNSLSVTAAGSILDMGATGSSTLTIIGTSAANTWNSTLRTDNWSGNLQTVTEQGTNNMVTANTGTDHIVTNNTTDFTAGQLAQIQFTGFYHTGPAQLINQYTSNGDNTYTWTGRYELAPTTAALKVGDVDLNQVVNISDVGAMMTALANLAAYDAQSPQSGYSASELSTVFNTFTPNDNQRNNLDVQALIVLLANGGSSAPGGGSLTAVPEPASFVLLGLGGALAMATAYRRRSRRG